MIDTNIVTKFNEGSNIASSKFQHKKELMNKMINLKYYFNFHVCLSIRNVTSRNGT